MRSVGSCRLVLGINGFGVGTPRGIRLGSCYPGKIRLTNKIGVQDQRNHCGRTEVRHPGRLSSRSKTRTGPRESVTEYHCPLFPPGGQYRGKFLFSSLSGYIGPGDHDRRALQQQYCRGASGKRLVATWWEL